LSHWDIDNTLISAVLASSVTDSINPLIATLKLQSNGSSYSNTVIGTLAVDGWTVTFGTTRLLVYIKSGIGDIRLLNVD